MIEGPNTAHLARTIGDPTRIRMLTLLMEGRALTAKELACDAGVAPATASAHLSRLENDGCVSSVSQGRYKYFQLASPDVARLIESMMVLAPQVQSSRVSQAPIRVARYCYDHLAGQLGTRLTQAFIARRLLRRQAEDKSFSVTGAGETWLSSFGVNLEVLRSSRRRLAYQCLDWSERKMHLGGALGAVIAERLIVLGWIEKADGSRVVKVTSPGRRGLLQQFDVSLDEAA